MPNKKINRMIIAEIGSVHDGSFGNAKKLIELAVNCGADCVKFQTHFGNHESLDSAPNPSYFSDEGRIEYFNRTSFSINQWRDLIDYSKELGIKFLSSPFCIEAVDLLEEIGVFAYKIPSGEVTNLPMLEVLSNTKKPIFLSTGMSNWDEIDQAYKIFKNNNLTIMQCSSKYPCDMKNVGLNILAEINERYNCTIGFSDHTLGYSASIAAAALGAQIIEKHITFSKNMYGSDALHSMEPTEFTLFCKEVKNTWEIMDNPVDKDDLSQYIAMKETFQKSIVAKNNLCKGSVLTFNDLAFKKPGIGIPANNYKSIIGCKLIKDIKKNDLLDFKDIDSNA